MIDKETQIRTLKAKLAMILEDLDNPMLEDQTTYLLNALGKIRKQMDALGLNNAEVIAELQK